MPAPRRLAVWNGSLFMSVDATAPLSNSETLTPTAIYNAKSGRSFGRAAILFDSDEAANPLARWARRRSFAALDAAFGPGDLVLEMGSGTGIEATHLAARGVRIVATDPAGGMLEQLRAKLAPGGPAAHLADQITDDPVARQPHRRTGGSLWAERVRRRLLQHGCAELRAVPGARRGGARHADPARRAAGLFADQSLLPVGNGLVFAGEAAGHGLPPLGRASLGHPVPPRLAGGAHHLLLLDPRRGRAHFPAAFRVVGRRALPWLLPPLYLSRRPDPPRPRFFPPRGPPRRPPGRPLAAVCPGRPVHLRVGPRTCRIRVSDPAPRAAEAAVLARLRCPACGGPLREALPLAGEGRATCADCSAGYTQAGGIWRLLTAAERRRYAPFLEFLPPAPPGRRLGARRSRLLFASAPCAIR